MTSAIQPTAGNGQTREDQNDQDNFNAPEISGQSPTQTRSQQNRDSQGESAQGGDAEGDPEGFIDESLPVEENPNETDFDEEALVLEGAGCEVDEDDEDPTDDVETATEEDSDLA